MKVASALALVISIVGDNGALGQTDSNVNTTVAPTSAPTVPPTESPTFGPAPECFTDIDKAALREAAVEDVSVPRTIILCPDTDYFMGRAGENLEEYVGGFVPIIPRPNSHWKCGENGLVTNNCVLKDGDFQIVSFGDLDMEHTNITFSGLTFEAAFNGGVLMAQAGDVTFSGCVFRVSVCDGGMTHF
jgi:hypothetical protein